MDFFGKASRFLPFSGAMDIARKQNSDQADKMEKINQKFQLFSHPSITKDERVQRLSITNQFDDKISPFSINTGVIRNDFYNNYIYLSQNHQKRIRILEYRGMAMQAEVKAALLEIRNEFWVEDENKKYVDFELKGEHNEEVREIIRKEFYKFLNIFKIKEKGLRYVMDFLIDGELFFENIVSLERPHLGIIGLTRVATERIDPLYYDVDNELIECYIVRKQLQEGALMDGRTMNQYPRNATTGNENTVQSILLNEAQVTYISPDEWDEKRMIRISPLEEAKRAYKQLTLTEDATVIYMLVRAPERFVFNIYTGNMTAAESEDYLRQQMSQFWTKKTMGQDGNVENIYNPVSMIENFYFAKPAGSEGSSVQSIGGGDASPDNLNILTYFVQKLYQALHVPLQRLNSADKFSDGTEVTREELKFARYVISLQERFAAAIKKAFITHLKFKGKDIKDLAKKLEVEYPASGNVSDLALVVAEIEKRLPEKISLLLERKDKLIDTLHQIKEGSLILENVEDSWFYSEIDKINVAIYELEETKSFWEQYELDEEDIFVKLNEPTQFHALRKQQEFQLKFDNYSRLASDDMISPTLALKKYMGWTDKELKQNREMLRKDAAFIWEVTQIQEKGPNFREIARKELEQAMGGGGMMGGAPGDDLLGGMEGGAPDADIDLPEFGEMPPEGGDIPEGDAPEPAEES